MSGRWLAIAASALLLAGAQARAVASADASPADGAEPAASGGVNAAPLRSSLAAAFEYECAALAPPAAAPPAAR